MEWAARILEGIFAKLFPPTADIIGRKLAEITESNLNEKSERDNFVQKYRRHILRFPWKDYNFSPWTDAGHDKILRHLELKDLEKFKTLFEGLDDSDISLLIDGRKIRVRVKKHNFSDLVKDGFIKIRFNRWGNPPHG